MTPLFQNNKNIKREARQRSKMPSDVDNMKIFYKETGLGLKVIYPSPEIYAYERFRYDVINESRRHSFRSEWNRKPDYASHFFYDSVTFWPILLLANNLQSAEEFINLDFLLVPSFDIINELTRHTRTESVDERKIDDNLLNVFKKHIMDKNELDKRKIIDEEDKLKKPAQYLIENIEREEQIIVTSKIIYNQYFDLNYVPSNISSLELYIDDFDQPQRFGFDYNIIADSDTGLFTRITWDSQYLKNENISLGSLIEEGSIITVNYIESDVYRYFYFPETPQQKPNE